MRRPSEIPSPSSFSPLGLSSFDPMSVQPEPERKLNRPLSSMRPTFAVDVSGSTSFNGALVAEKDAIAKISDLLEYEKHRWSCPILPWNSEAHAPCDRKTINTLHSDGGTTPAALFHQEKSQTILRESSVWFLMTDGKIQEKEVVKFSRNFCKSGLHGVAGVIIVFGHSKFHPTPFKCNVSVGLSVYGVAPHTIFLFHDIETGVVYVLQAKGQFVEILPESRQLVRLEEATRWEDLTQITYDDLVKVQIPEPELLDRHVIKLPSGHKVNMQRLYDNKLPSDEIFDLVGSNCALDAIIIAAQTTGNAEKLTAALKTALKQGTDSARSSMNLSIVYLRAILQDAFNASGADPQQPNDMWLALKQQRFTQTIDIVSMKARLRKEHTQNRKLRKGFQDTAGPITFLETFSSAPNRDDWLEEGSPACNPSSMIRRGSGAQEISTRADSSGIGRETSSSTMENSKSGQFFDGSMSSDEELPRDGEPIPSKKRSTTGDASRLDEGVLGGDHRSIAPDSTTLTDWTLLNIPTLGSTTLDSTTLDSTTLNIATIHSPSGDLVTGKVTTFDTATLGYTSADTTTLGHSTLGPDISSFSENQSFEEFTADTRDLRECCICGEQQSLQMFLLRNHYRPEEPFILPITSCFGCSRILKAMGALPNGEDPVTEALPDAQITDQKERNLWQKTRRMVIQSYLLRSLWSGSETSSTWLRCPCENFVQLMRFYSIFLESERGSGKETTITALVWHKFLYELVHEQLKVSALEGHQESLQKLKEALGFLNSSIAMLLTPWPAVPDNSKQQAPSDSGVVPMPQYIRTYHELQETYLLPRKKVYWFNHCVMRTSYFYLPISLGDCDRALEIFLCYLVAKFESMDDSTSLDTLHVLNEMRKHFANASASRGPLQEPPVRNIFMEPQDMTADEAKLLIERIGKFKVPGSEMVAGTG